MFVVANGSSKLIGLANKVDILFDIVSGVECRRAKFSRAFMSPALGFKGVFVRFGSINKLVSSLDTTVVLRPDNFCFLSSFSVSKRTTGCTPRDEQHADSPLYAIYK